MKINLIKSREGKPISLDLNSWAMVLVSLFVFGVPLGVGVATGLARGDKENWLVEALGALETELNAQKLLLAEGQERATHQLATYSSKLAEMQARLVRLDALGDHIVNVAGLDSGEFDFSNPPAVGGPRAVPLEAAKQTDVDLVYDELNKQLIAHERQLGLLRIMMADRQFKRENTVAGRPVEKGWMSSGYGVRLDPFDGSKVWHKGVDFAGREGSPVIAVAAGIVTRAESVKGYGDMVEVDHGDGLIARYAHNSENLVSIGELVKKEQIIARMGSTGRSTGSHVHFELYKHGRHIDPASYVWRTVR